MTLASRKASTHLIYTSPDVSNELCMLRIKRLSEASCSGQQSLVCCDDAKILLANVIVQVD